MLYSIDQGRIVVICEDVFNNLVFRPFKDLHQSSAGTDLNNKEYTYDVIMKELQNVSNVY